MKSAKDILAEEEYEDLRDAEYAAFMIAKQMKQLKSKIRVPKEKKKEKKRKEKIEI